VIVAEGSSSLHKTNDHNALLINAYCIILQQNLFWDNMLCEYERTYCDFTFRGL